MGRAGWCWHMALELMLASCAVWGLCPFGWVLYRSTLCIFVPAKELTLSWSQARAFCHERKAELIVIADHKKQIFLTELTDSSGGPGSQYWMGLAQLAGASELTWVDGTPISESWYRNWLWSHPKGKHCVQLVGFYLNRWRDWDCNSRSSFICEMPAADAFPSSERALYFRSHCYTFHFPAVWGMRTWPQALAFCKQSGGSLASVQSEEENAFLSDAFPEDGWHMWIGLQFSTAWQWSDDSSSVYSKWHHAATSNLSGQCAVMVLCPADFSRLGMWETRGCDMQPLTEATGFFCKYSHGPCMPPAPVEFPLHGGMGPYSTADVVFSMPCYSVCTMVLTKIYTRAALLQLSLESNATHVSGSMAAEFTGATVLKQLSPVHFSTGLNTWGFITFPAGMIGFFNHQEQFRVFSDQALSFANLGSLLISGVTVVNASLEYRASSVMHLPNSSPAPQRMVQLENAVPCYLSSFTLGLWVRTTFSSSDKMCLLSYSVRARPAELALFLLAPEGLEFWFKGVVMLRGTTGLLLDGSWHHLAISISSELSTSPYQVFIDGESWEPDFADSACVLQKGLTVGGTLNVGWLENMDEGAHALGSPYIGELSEVNLWDRALSRLSVKQLATSRDKWKFPGNVVSWNQLVDAKSGAVEITTASHRGAAAFVWIGLLWLVGRLSVLCLDPGHRGVYVESAVESCPENSLWGLQLDGRLRSLMVPSSCLLVGLDRVSLGYSSACSSDTRSSFRLLPDQRLQNLHSGFCVFQKPRSPGVFLQKCSSRALHFALDEDVYCPRAQGWRSRKKKCLHIVSGAALEWSQALKYCQRFQNGSLLTLSSLEDLNWWQEKLSWSVWTGLHGIHRGSLPKWADGTSFNKALESWILPAEVPTEKVCVLLLPSGLLKEELCERPHHWVCQTPQRNALYMEFRGKSFYGSFSADTDFSSLLAAKAQCTLLGRGCNAVLSTAGCYYLYRGTRFVSLEDPAVDPAASVHIKAGCVPGYTGLDCQSECPECDAGVSCNPLTGTCDGLLYYRQSTGSQAAEHISLKCPPFAGWAFRHGSCVLLEHKGSQHEVEPICRRYLAAEVLEIKPSSDMVCEPSSKSRGPEKRCPSRSFWSCQRAEDLELLPFWEKLLVSFRSLLWQRHVSLGAAKDSCFLQRENCTGVVQLQGTHYTVNGTVLVASPGSGATLYVKTACSPGYYGVSCARRCRPCPSTRACNPLNGRCEGRLSCVRRDGPSCPHGLVSTRCPGGTGWWYWDGHCYYVEESDAKTWQQAEAACHASGEGSELLTLDSLEEEAWVAAMVQRDSWTGLNDLDGDGRWMWAGAQHVDGAAPWLDGVPLGLGGCLGIGDPGDPGLAVSNCSELKPWVCERGELPISRCPTEPGWRHWNGSCYYRDPSLASTWQEGLQVCRRFRQTELLYLTSSQEKDWVCSNFQGPYWAGLNDQTDESVFQWTTREPLTRQLAEHLRDDLADGGLKDCVWLDTMTGLLRDASCEERKPFICKCSEATEWFVKQPHQGVVGNPELLHPSVESLEQAKQECLQERSVCAAVLQAGTGFYLISSVTGIISRPNSTLYMWTSKDGFLLKFVQSSDLQRVCAEGFSGQHCHRPTASPAGPACDCSGRVQVSATQVCGVPVQSCVDYCRHTMTQSDCSLCLPLCTDSNLSILDPEELAVVSMVQSRVSQFPNLTAEDERDQMSASKIIYDSQVP